MNVYTGILIGILSSLAATALWKVASGSLYKFLSGGYSVSGFWCTRFEPLSPSNSDSVEFLRIRQWRDDIHLYLENYNRDRPKILKLRGQGKYRSSQLVACYYFINKQHPGVGTFVLRSRDTEAGIPSLQGCYTQPLDRCESRSVKISKSPYVLQLCKLNWRVRLRALFRGSLFADYKDALTAFEIIDASKCNK